MLVVELCNFEKVVDDTSLINSRIALKCRRFVCSLSFNWFQRKSVKGIFDYFVIKLEKDRLSSTARWENFIFSSRQLKKIILTKKQTKLLKFIIKGHLERLCCTCSSHYVLSLINFAIIHRS